jgi:hypothetical protein
LQVLHPKLGWLWKSKLGLQGIQDIPGKAHICSTISPSAGLLRQGGDELRMLAMCGQLVYLVWRRGGVDFSK